MDGFLSIFPNGMLGLGVLISGSLAIIGTSYFVTVCAGSIGVYIGQKFAFHARSSYAKLKTLFNPA